MKLRFLLLTLLSFAGLVAARAQSAIDAWTVWPTSNYTSVDATSGDGVIATTTGASVAYSTDYIYTFMSTPTWTLTTDTLADVSTITLEIVLAGGSGGVPLLAAPVLDFGDGFDLASGVTIAPTGGNILGNAASAYTYTWNVSDFSAASSFSIVWQLNQHAAVSSVTLTQNVSAVPEPSAFAALAGLAGLGFAALRRRRI